MTKFRVRLRGRNSPNSPGNTLVTILRMLIITLRIFTYSFTICDSSFYKVADIVPSVSDRAVNKIGQLPILRDAGRQCKEVDV